MDPHILVLTKQLVQPRRGLPLPNGELACHVVNKLKRGEIPFVQQVEEVRARELEDG